MLRCLLGLYAFPACAIVLHRPLAIATPYTLILKLEFAHQERKSRCEPSLCVRKGIWFLEVHHLLFAIAAQYCRQTLKPESVPWGKTLRYLCGLSALSEYARVFHQPLAIAAQYCHLTLKPEPVHWGKTLHSALNLYAF